MFAAIITAIRSIMGRISAATAGFRVVYVSGSGHSEQLIRASYLQEEGSLVTLKDATGAVVFAVNAHALICVERFADDLPERVQVQE